ncbi:MAG: hypothetical protein AAGL18_02510 [Pseudomonadota bacterium]
MKIRVLCALALGLVLAFGGGGNAYSDLKTAQSAQSGSRDDTGPSMVPARPTR